GRPLSWRNHGRAMSPEPQRKPPVPTPPKGAPRNGADGNGRFRANGMPRGATWGWFLAALLANYLVVRFFMPGTDAPLTVSYTFFREQVAAGNVESIFGRGETITGRFEEPVTYPPPPNAADASEDGGDAAEHADDAVPEAARGGRADTDDTSRAPAGRSSRLPKQEPPRTGTTFTTTLPSFIGPNLESFLIEHGVEISAEPIETGPS